MANVKISDLAAYTDAASTDVLPIVDVSNNVTKKISIADLLKAAPLGSAAAPGIAFDGDPDTGVFSAGANQIGLATNGIGRLWITNTGSILFRKSGESLNAEGLQFEPAIGVGITKDNGTPLTLNRQTNDGNAIAFYRGTTSVLGSIVGSVSVTATSTAYNTSSDYRLKENIIAVTDGITRLRQLKPSRFNFIADPAKTVDGFIAHEVKNVVPEAVTGEKDAVDDEGNPIYQGIDQSKLVPLLTAALQEAVARIEQLETAVAALQGS